jgi:hypothetical protein
MDRLALRIEHSGLQGDEDAGFHGLFLCGPEFCAPMAAPLRFLKLYSFFTKIRAQS